MKITKCVCSDVSFRKLKEHAQTHNLKSFEKLQQELPFGKSCELCHPYVRKMLEDGTVEFSELLPPIE